jgi:hypothetical protein
MNCIQCRNKQNILCEKCFHLIYDKKISQIKELQNSRTEHQAKISESFYEQIQKEDSSKF